MTLTTIEKAAKLMGYEISTPELDTLAMTMPHSKGSAWVTKGAGGWVWFNPYTNKADLMDVECALGIDVFWVNSEDIIIASYSEYSTVDSAELVADHQDKFTARSHAVMAVVEQIYDRQFGGK